MSATYDVYQRDLIDRVLAFASLRSLDDKAQLEELFAAFGATVADPDTLRAPQADLRKLLWMTWDRRLLKRIAQKNVAILWRVEDIEPFEKLAQHCTRVGLITLDRDRRVCEKLGPIRAPSAEAACGYALTLLWDTKRPWGQLLRSCERDYCKIFFLSKSINKGGWGDRMCSEDCRDDRGIESKIPMDRAAYDWFNEPISQVGLACASKMTPRKRQAQRIQAVAIRRLKSDGTLAIREDTSDVVLRWESRALCVEMSIPFDRASQLKGHVSSFEALSIPASGGRPTRILPYALDIWERGWKVFHMQWNGGGIWGLIKFTRGDWEKRLQK